MKKIVLGLDLKTFEIKSHNVAKLAELVDCTAKALQVPSSRVRTAAAQLRKCKLLSTGPRGPAAPEMTPTDAASLLLAVMYDGELATADRSVTSLSKAQVIRSKHRKFGEADDRLEDFPRNGFFGPQANPLTFGEVVATILDWFVRYGSLEEGDDFDLDLSVVNLTVTTTSPGFGASIHFNTHEGFWKLAYEWKPPEQIAYEAENQGLLATRWDALNGPYMWSSRTISGDSLHLIAECLRGCEWDDQCEEFSPPYELTPVTASEMESV